MDPIDTKGIKKESSVVSKVKGVPSFDQGEGKQIPGVNKECMGDPSCDHWLQGKGGVHLTTEGDCCKYCWNQSYFCEEDNVLTVRKKRGHC